MGVDDSTQPLTIYNTLSTLLIIKTFLGGILLTTFDMNYHNRKKIQTQKLIHVTSSVQQTKKGMLHVNDLFKFR